MRFSRPRAFPRGDGLPERVVASSLAGKIKDAWSYKLEKLCRLCRKQRRGAAVVEFAIVAPVFFLLLLGMIEFGRMIMVQQIITNASREGARVAVLDGTTTDDVVDTVNNYLSSAAINGANITVDPDPPSDAGYGEPVTVSVSVPFSQVSWLPSPMFLGGTNLSASTVMRRETVQ
ncbi:MAG: pilus assembly protein [Planctomycetota bacterium]|nr:MAG: pilus assembly protein [Planctomycetota bacterium]